MARLKSVTASKVRMFSGRVLKSTGPATTKDLSPSFFVLEGTEMIKFDFDRSDLDGTRQDISPKIFLR